MDLAILNVEGHEIPQIYMLMQHLQATYQTEFVPAATCPIIRLKVSLQLKSRKSNMPWKFVTIDLTFDVSNKMESVMAVTRSMKELVT